MLLAVERNEGMIAVVKREGTNAVGREEFVFIEHDLQHAAELAGIDDREQASFAQSCMLATFAVRSGRLSMNHSMRRLKPGRRSM
jgi:hypothetical protein